MKRLLITIFVLLPGITAFAMDLPMVDVGQKRPAQEIEEIVAESKEARITTEPQNYLFAKYPLEIQETIRSFLNTAPGFGAEKLYNVAKNIRAQRLVSKTERDKLDDPEFVGQLITDLAYRYARNNEIKVVVALHTKSAADWLNNMLLKEREKTGAGDFRYFEKEVTKELIAQLAQGHTDAARFLLSAAKVPQENSYMLSFRFVNAEGQNLLAAAVNVGDLKILNTLLPFIPQAINTINRHGDTLLLEAISLHNTPIALALLRAGANPFVIENDVIQDSALLRASSANNFLVVEELLRNPEVQEHVNFSNDWYPFTPLEYAARNNNYPMFKALSRVPGAKLTGDALYYALANNTQMVEDLITRGIQVNQEAAEFKPAAFGIFYEKYRKSVVADADARDRLALLLPNLEINKPERQTAITLLMRAVQQAKAKTVEKLLEAGADVSLQDNQGHDALWYANQLQSNNKDHIVKMLETAIAKQGDSK